MIWLGIGLYCLVSVITAAIFCRSIHKAKVRSGEIWYA